MNNENKGLKVNMENNTDMNNNAIKLDDMYQSWFIDYASYVILERAVPNILDGLKPVQRRLLHSIKEMDDGRYNKVANIIGNTMKYHPHGDASIGDALVNMAQKNLLIDIQGNWGNIYTADKAAAPRYIEARLSKFALDVVYNNKVTNWTPSYDGRNKEPINLPIKFPLLLAHGTEGIAVGLSTKILPHNFVELIDASISVLRGKKIKIFPDFPTAGIADFSMYNDGVRGGRVKIRAKIKQIDSKLLQITEIPYGSNTSSIIDSIIKANERGKIKIKKIEDNTAEFVEILIYLNPGISPDKTIDALYAFTDCEISISPNCCVIENNRPLFLSISEVLKRSTNNTLSILKKELEFQLKELKLLWHQSCLEIIFIKYKLYLLIQDCESWDEILIQIKKGLKPYLSMLKDKIEEEDIIKLTELKIKKISKFDFLRAEANLKQVEKNISDVKFNLSNIINYSIEYFKNLKKKYKHGNERKTESRLFNTIIASKVAIRNKKLFINREDGFIGTSLKKDEFLFECSDIDDIIIFKKDATMFITKVAEKKFIGKEIIHISIFKKNNERTIYNYIYNDFSSGFTFMKRFFVKSITRDKKYSLGSSNNKSNVLYFTENLNGESEIVTVTLKSNQKKRKLKFDIDFSDINIKSKNSKGNLVSKFKINKISLKTRGKSTLEAQKIWFDDNVLRLNFEENGEFLGNFSSEDKILVIYQSGEYKLMTPDLNLHFSDNIIHISKYNEKDVVTAIYWDGLINKFFVKRFEIENFSKKNLFISSNPNSYLEAISLAENVSIIVDFYKEPKKPKKPNQEINLINFTKIKSFKAKGKILSKSKIKNIIINESKNLKKINDSEIKDNNFNNFEEINKENTSQFTLDL